MILNFLYFNDNNGFVDLIVCVLVWDGIYWNLLI